MATTKIPLYPDEANYLATNFPQYLNILGTNFPVPVLAFDATTDQAAFWQFRAHKYKEGNINLNIIWYSPSVLVNNVVWEAQIGAITPESDSQSVESKSLDSVSFVQDTHLGTTSTRLHETSIAISNLNSLAAEDICFLRLARDADSTNATDDMASDAYLVMAILSYTSL